jgi:hypothetical protein
MISQECIRTVSGYVSRNPVERGDSAVNLSRDGIAHVIVYILFDVLNLS